MIVLNIVGGAVVNVGLFQYDILWEDRVGNRAKISSLLGSNDISKNLDWLMFPEMTLSGFSMDASKTTLNDKDIDFFKNIARSYCCHVSFGGVIDYKNKIITLNEKGDIINEYSKIHLFTRSGEDKTYQKGRRQDPFNIGEFRITPTICYDLRFTHLFWDKALNTDVFVVIANWPQSRRTHWLCLLKARAIENQCFVIGVNRTGDAPKLSYSGDSIVVSPMGDEVLNCGSDEGVFTTTLSKQDVTGTRETLPFLKDRNS